MSKFVAGSYATVEAVETAVKGLLEKGHNETDLLLVTNSPDKKERLAKKTGIEVISETGHDENSGWKDLAPLYPSFDEEALYEPSPSASLSAVVTGTGRRAGAQNAGPTSPNWRKGIF